MRLLQPDLRVESLINIDLEALWQRDHRGLIVDLDNTLAPWRQEKLSPMGEEFLHKAKERGFKICLVTNAGKIRAERIATFYNLTYVAPALKPRTRSFVRALEILGLSKENVSVIGDQIFTDILGGNLAGCYTILVPPLHQHEFVVTKFMRHLEKIVAYRELDK